jgi:hypothetical protein
MRPSAIEEPPGTAGIRISRAYSWKSRQTQKNDHARPPSRSRAASMPLPRRFHTAWTKSGHRLRRRISEAEQPQTINLLATRRYFLKNIFCRCRVEAMAATNN